MREDSASEMVAASTSLICFYAGGLELQGEQPEPEEGWVLFEEELLERGDDLGFRLRKGKGFCSSVASIISGLESNLSLLFP
ncbi:hypothetical protein MRB53_023946 [Persea americana]|uniref:Uncharacterized protein n=1 Tax=Persea americana TaxID=3435 RepID=A0ACC2LBD6_PERAE|nr:hypothetical protein MRB53_023946 [Persea americana]